MDITVYRNGYHGDLNETFFIGEVEEGARKLVQTTYECLMQAIDEGECPVDKFETIFFTCGLSLEERMINYKPQ